MALLAAASADSHPRATLPGAHVTPRINHGWASRGVDRWVCQCLARRREGRTKALDAPKAISPTIDGTLL